MLLEYRSRSERTIVVQRRDESDLSQRIHTGNTQGRIYKWISIRDRDPEPRSDSKINYPPAEVRGSEGMGRARRGGEGIRRALPCLGDHAVGSHVDGEINRVVRLRRVPRRCRFHVGAPPFRIHPCAHPVFAAAHPLPPPSSPCPSVAFSISHGVSSAGKPFAMDAAELKSVR